MTTTPRHLTSRRVPIRRALHWLGFMDAGTPGLSGSRQFLIALGGGLLAAALVAWWLFSAA